MECPICMDAIDVTKNSVVTDCGHAFHCSCLMQNAAHNGFGCPYCRTTMANEPPLEDDYDDDEDETIALYEGEEVSDDALTTFRMFMQRLDGEEPEEDEEDNWETEDEDEDEEEDEEPAIVPDAAYMAAKLMERGITYEKLVKSILFQEHNSWDRYYQDYARSSGEVYGQFRAVISRYRPTLDVPAVAPELALAPAPASALAPEIAEPKTTNAIPRRREFMSHV